MAAYTTSSEVIYSSTCFCRGRESRRPVEEAGNGCVSGVVRIAKGPTSSAIGGGSRWRMYLQGDSNMLIRAN